MKYIVGINLFLIKNKIKETAQEGGYFWGERWGCDCREAQRLKRIDYVSNGMMDTQVLFFKLFIYIRYLCDIIFKKTNRKI